MIRQAASRLKRPGPRPWRGRLGDRRGNVAIIAALCMIPLMLSVGMGIDYTLQKRSQDQLAGIADAAVLVAVTPTMMAETQLQATKAAQAFWDAQSATVSNVAGVTGTVVVSEPASASGTAITRTATITWTGASANNFASLTGLPTSPLKGSSSAVSSRAPVVNFYLMVDTSPSMGIVTSDTATMAAMMKATKSYEDTPNGCAFACHQSDPGGDGLSQDLYSVARSLGLNLRIDLVNYAVSNLMSTAASVATSNKTTYGVSVSTIDYKVGDIYQTSNITTNLTAAKNAVGTIQQLEVYKNNCLTSSQCSLTNNGDDQLSNLDLGLTTLDTLSTGTYTSSKGPGYKMYTPGTGTTNAGDTPQEVLFIISDGMDDFYSSGSRTIVPINSVQDYCSTIKAQGIRIAFLQLYYAPLPTDPWYVSAGIETPRSQIAASAQSCASPGLYQLVTSDADISAELTSLFQKVVATARLTH
jgi:Flp pilus assembly protein TadG